MSPLMVRPLASPEEKQIYYRLSRDAFTPQASNEEAARWEHLVSQSPEFRAEQVRGAFRDGQLLGGYTMHERVLRMGAARISTGCISAVVTDPAYRKQGAATALLQDAFAFARQWNHPLLLLDGIPNFYFRYGYIDLFDTVGVEVDRTALLAQPPAKHRIRLATSDDAQAILGLYERHFGVYTGSFERTLEIQTYRLQHTQVPPVVALSPQGGIAGYLFYGTGEGKAQGREIAADTWDALLALLHYHAHMLDTDSAVNTLLYFLPLDAPMTQWMIDTLEVPDTSHWHSSTQEWGVRTQTYHHRFTGWMGCLTNFPALMRSILPELQRRWQHSLARWSGKILLMVDGQACLLQLTDAGVQLEDGSEASGTDYRLELTSQALVQWVFGYRPLAQLTDSAHLSREARSVLAILFPPAHTWIPRTDWF